MSGTACALSSLRRAKDWRDLFFAVLGGCLQVVQFLVQVSNVRLQFLSFQAKALLHLLGGLQNEPTQTINKGSCWGSKGKGEYE